MTKDGIAKAATAALLAAALGFVILRKTAETRSGAPEGKPQEAIYSMLDAARTGDVKRFLASYSGAPQANLKQALAEQGEASFRANLRTRNAEIKGVAVNEPKPLSAREVEVKVEYVYSDRNETQTMILENSGSGWKIARIDPAGRIKTLVQYGTPVQ